MVHGDRTSADRIVSLGHATVLIELDGVALLTDPLLRPRVAHLLRRVPPADVEIARHADVVLISHVHHDHLDLPSLRLLRRDTPIVVPAGAGGWMRDRGFGEVRELGVGEELEIESVTVTAVEARHDGHRYPRGPHAQAVGYLVGGGRTIYFAGDTALFEGMSALSQGLDVALLPVAGWGPTLGPGHMDPLDAARATTMLRPRVAVPIHWGTLRPIGLGRGHPGWLEDPPHLFARHVASVAPSTYVRILAPGQEMAL
jgi:L-ascorbate metabolism protein UlaG (beta-lactamase superfamily)